ncbi:hypothetical protein [Streptomyces sp. NPDC047928]|uniref:hypothetical protein n=1 Tax=unclassified Streptomyces TaxID=2593676 RepID=UPI00371DA726
MIKKALACAALVTAAMAIGTVPAAALNNDDGCACDHGSFHAKEWSAMHFHYLEQDGGSVIASGGAADGSSMGATW